MFNNIIVENFSNPTFAGELDAADVVLEMGNPVCGDRIKVQLKFTGERIDTARYQAWGCATSLATGNIFCAYANEQSLAKILATPVDAIDQMLGELDPSQHHCLDMLKELFSQLRRNTEQGALCR